MIAAGHSMPAIFTALGLDIAENDLLKHMAAYGAKSTSITEADRVNMQKIYLGYGKIGKGLREKIEANSATLKEEMCAEDKKIEALELALAKVDRNAAIDKAVERANQELEREQKRVSLNLYIAIIVKHWEKLSPAGSAAETESRRVEIKRDLRYSVFLRWVQIGASWLVWGLWMWLKWGVIFFVVQLVLRKSWMLFTKGCL